MIRHIQWDKTTILPIDIVTGQSGTGSNYYGSPNFKFAMNVKGGWETIPRRYIFWNQIALWPHSRSGTSVTASSTVTSLTSIYAGVWTEPEYYFWGYYELDVWCLSSSKSSLWISPDYDSAYLYNEYDLWCLSSSNSALWTSPDFDNNSSFLYNETDVWNLSAQKTGFYMGVDF